MPYDNDQDDNIRELALCCWNPLTSTRKMPAIEADINDEQVSPLERWRDRAYIVNA